MDNKLHAACIGILIVCIVLMIMNTLKDEADLHLVQDSLGCEALVIQGSVSNVPMLFMVDTAYAGAPVLSTSYLAVTSAVSIMPDKQMSVTDTYQEVLTLLQTVDPVQRKVGLVEFINRAKCRSYTSGCTMRLMGIGTTHETRSDLLLCQALKIWGHVTYSLQILTLLYLFYLPGS